ncbi:alpha/beta fold hydrolase [Limnoglobus roseus]|uniref:Alpha/beta hydrolase n=1 Tax=Limnoglobus roseus TaxID=2598579 RepID=A0A5C1A9F7_9BACT|nr:alpha/beta hydrolase [Limnoglobus roseus]QEL14442.1 alpha/beta hydrolase [Limnoglobus roseus]
MTLSHTSTGEGMPVVLLHAFPFSSEMWRPQMTLTNAFRLITPDLPGFGQSPLRDDLTTETMADAVAELLGELKLTEPIVLGGCSMGGYVALAFARKYPQRLRGLLLNDTKADPDDDAAKAGRNKMIDAAATLTAATVIDGLLPKQLSDTTRQNRPAVVDEARRIGATQPIAGIVAAQKAMRDRPDSRPVLGQIRVPTLIVVGEHDPITPPALAKGMAAAIAGSQLEVIPTAAHLPNLETASEFNAIVRSWLERIERPI